MFHSDKILYLSHDEIIKLPQVDDYCPLVGRLLPKPLHRNGLFQTTLFALYG